MDYWLKNVHIDKLAHMYDKNIEDWKHGRTFFELMKIKLIMPKENAWIKLQGPCMKWSIIKIASIPFH